MPDYRERYLEMVYKTERVVQIPVNVQHQCEDIYAYLPETELTWKLWTSTRMIPHCNKIMSCEKSIKQLPFSQPFLTCSVSLKMELLLLRLH